MNHANKFFFLVGIVALIGFSGCARYRAKPLKKLNVHVDRQAKKPHIEFDCYVFDKADCKTYLDRSYLFYFDGWSKCGFRPVQIAFANNSRHSFEVGPDGLSLPTVSVDEVVKAVRHSIVEHGVLAGVLASVIGFPIAMASIGCHY